MTQPASSSAPARPRLRRLLVEPQPELSGDADAFITAQLNAAAPPGGVEIHFDTNNPDVLRLPASASVLAGTDLVKVRFEVAPTAERVDAEISASVLPGSPMTIRVAVLPLGPAPAAAHDEPHPQLHVPAHFPPLTPQDARAALLAILPFLPLGATIAMIAVYLAPIHVLPETAPLSFVGGFFAALLPLLKAHLVLSGAAIALIVGLLVGAASYSIVGAPSADRANVAVYVELCGRLRRVQVNITTRRRQGQLDASQQIALQEADAYQRLAWIELGARGLRWALGTGYIAVWGLVHRAEEALIPATSVADAAGIAAYDHLRLTGSNIHNRDDLMAMLKKAMAALSPPLGAYLDSPPANGQVVASADPLASIMPSLSPTGARQVLREVRHSINIFRDDNWAALVRTRNHLLATFSLASTIVYLVTVVAISGRDVNDTPSNIATDSIAVAAVLFLVGAVTGMLETLRADGGSQNAIEDYGVARARLSVSPLLSGLTALGGVLLVHYLPPALAGVTQGALALLPSGAGAARDVVSVPTLNQIFSLQTNAGVLVPAAVFGFAPNVFLRVLRSAARRYETALTSTGSTANLDEEKAKNPSLRDRIGTLATRSRDARGEPQARHR